MIEDSRPLMVSIRCIAYNQARYIRQCLEGFVMQQTNFRFEAIVHDDASTDGTDDIIREYAEKYPDIIKPIFETENQYSKHDGSLRQIMNDHQLGKYVAICEGDDYWTDPLKLQKQYDFMEANPDCSLCFHANNNLLPSGEERMHRPKVIKKFYTTNEVILGGGDFMATNSMFYRNKFVKNEDTPDFWKNSPVGDAPCMLFLASKGSVGYIDEIMSVYRICAQGSWSNLPKSISRRSAHFRAIANMYDQYDRYTNFKYHRAIMKKKFINSYHRYRDNFLNLLLNIKSAIIKK